MSDSLSDASSELFLAHFSGSCLSELEVRNLDEALPDTSEAASSAPWVRRGRLGAPSY